MIIFNTTLHLDDSIHDECLKYLKEVYIPGALEGDILCQPSLARIESKHEEGGLSYALQFKAEDIDVLDNWVEKVGESLQKELARKFGNKVNGFVTLLEEISL